LWLTAMPLLLSSVQDVSSSSPLPTIARVHYDGGGDWYANPSSLPNLPYLYLTGHGNLSFSDREIRALRKHLRSGGFLHADDNYGLDNSFRREIARVFPDEVLADVPLDHPVYGILYPFPDGLPKIHEHDGLPAQGLGLFLDGRLVLFYSYQSDLGDGWEDASVHQDPPELREQAIRIGVNLFLYALSAGPPR